MWLDTLIESFRSKACAPGDSAALFEAYAREIRDRGARGALVGLRATNSSASLAALLAAWSEGASVLLLPSTLSAEESRETGRHFGARWILTPETGGGSGWEQAAPVARATSPGEALVVLSSGSTAKRKAVVLTFANLEHNVSSSLGVLRFRPGGGALPLTPLSHVSGLRFTLSALALGCPLSLLTLPADGGIARRLIRERKIHYLSTSQASLASLLGARASDGDELSSLEGVTIGGAELPAALAAELAAQAPRTSLHFLYGLSEATSIFAVHTQRGGTPKAGVLGKPIPGMEFRLRNPDARGIGELEIRGESLMKGYLGEAPLDRASWFPTGDLAHTDEDGDLRSMGRTHDRIVLPTGAPVYPREVERALLASSAFSDCFASAAPDASGQVELFLVAKPGNAAGDALPAVLGALGERAKELGPYLKVRLVPSIPRDAMGKVPRDSLIALRY